MVFAFGSQFIVVVFTSMFVIEKSQDLNKLMIILYKDMLLQSRPISRVI